MSILDRIRAGGGAGVFVCGNVDIGFNSSDGSVETLVVRGGAGGAGGGAAGHDWAAGIGSLAYQTFTEEDFVRFATLVA